MNQSRSSNSNASKLETLIAQMVDKLAHTISMLESDEIIEQMRNDDSLYEFKMEHIKKIL